MKIIYWTYYLFVFSIPFETLRLGFPGGTLTNLVGLALPLVAWPLPAVCFRRPPKAFWCFAGALAVVIVLGCLQPRILWRAIATQVFTSVQLLVIFWISWSLMHDERVVERTLLVFGTSCTTLAILQVLGITETHAYAERTSALGFNPNELAALLSVGLLVLVGLAYGRRQGNARRRLLALIGVVFVGGVIVSLGSRGGSLALAMGSLGLLFKRTTLPSKLALMLGSVAMLGLLVFASYSSEPIRQRWENTLRRGDVAGRDKIYAQAWQMFLDKPVLGWGPVMHLFELGSRLGLESRDPHNSYLWLVDESGLCGSIPFLVGLGLCWRAAWMARRKTEGGLPLALLICISAVSLKGTYHFAKFFWIVLAYVLASSISRGVRSGASWRAQPRHGTATRPVLRASWPALNGRTAAGISARSARPRRQLDPWTLAKPGKAQIVPGRGGPG